MKTLREAIQSTGAHMYRDESYNHKFNAQRNLDGRTHYVDDATLKAFRSRINDCRVMSDGLFLMIRESCSADHQHRTRVNRCVLFDVFGTVVYRPDIDEGYNTGAAAERVFWEWFNEFDENQYYVDVLSTQILRKAREVQLIRDALDDIREK